ncbi:MAG: Mur ligase family protein, partial [Longimicrobiales bacterium]
MVPEGASILTYARLVDELFPRLTGRIRWGLDRTRRVLESVSDPHTTYPSIHIGGTNGKGSTAAMAASTLRAHGLRTGLYTSPHLCTFRERIQIDGAPISESALLAAAERLWPAIQEEGASFFEATTAIAFLAFANAAVDIAVIEVGLGGRLDSTNVISPLVSVITNISLDHVQLLGNTLESVATEKAGILKAGVPAVTAEVAGPASNVLYATADALGVQLRTLSAADVSVERIDRTGTTFVMDTAEWGTQMLRTRLIGDHQARNAALAVAAVELLPVPLRPDLDAVSTGLDTVTWPGRLQVEQIAGSTWI